ncbi:DUF1279 super [Malassezia yamatoensis]|uniref:DUF1279 super n=1 Tax=Malassezia yamatoensis TaxID=253288 RepID=A0AAJ5YTS3_9BASI|nr:DUF1279 super [Malassezia yamatoensis]
MLFSSRAPCKTCIRVLRTGLPVNTHRIVSQSLAVPGLRRATWPVQRSFDQRWTFAFRQFATQPPQTPASKPVDVSVGEVPKPTLNQAEKVASVGFRQRLRDIMRRYGWWALGIYLAIGLVDLSVALAAVHYYGGDRVQEIERVVRGWVGLSKKEEEEMLQQPSDSDKTRPLIAVQKDSSDMQKLLAQLSTELVLAYGIHKTLLLPPRAAITAAITPSVVRWFVRRGWARPIKNAANAA